MLKSRFIEQLMKNLQAYRKQISEIEALISKLEKGELNLNELVELEKLTASLHEKSIILKYKAFETHVKEDFAPLQEEPLQLEKEVEPQPIEPLVEEEQPALDFSIFDQMEMEEPIVEIEEEELVEGEEIRNEIPPIVEEKEAEEEKIEAVIEPKEVSKPGAGHAIWEQTTGEDDSLSAKFAGAKIETLVGAFGLNEKLRYINDLFDGSSELFSDAVKLLDSQANLESAKVKLSELTREHSWDSEKESVIEFITFVNRRYA